MTKRHFIALADVIKKQCASDDRFTQTQIEKLADFFEQQNSRFDRARWLEYIAGVNGKNGGKAMNLMTTQKMIDREK